MKELILFQTEFKSVVAGRRSAMRLVMSPTDRKIQVDLSDAEQALVDTITGVAVSEPNANGIRILTALFGTSGAINQTLAIHIPERPGVNGGVVGGVMLSQIPQTKRDPETKELEIVRRDDPANPNGPGRQIQWDRFNATDPGMQMTLNSAQVKICLAAIAADDVPVAKEQKKKAREDVEAAYSEG